MEHCGHSAFLKKCLENNIIDSKCIKAYKVNNRDSVVSSVSKPIEGVQNKTVKSKPDPRLKSDEFKAAVRLCFEDLGLKNNMANFREYDKYIAWLDYAKNLKNPELIWDENYRYNFLFSIQT